MPKNRCYNRMFTRTVLQFALLCLTITFAGCGDDKQADTQPDLSDSNAPADTITSALLNKNARYRIPIPVILYPELGKEHLDDSVLADLLIMPAGTIFLVEDYQAAEGTVWYSILVTGGPKEGWAKTSGHLHGQQILEAIGRSGGIPGWINGNDLDGQLLPQLPDKPDKTKEKK